MEEGCSSNGELQVQSWEHVCGVQKVTRSSVWLDQSECNIEVTGARSCRILKAVVRNLCLTE